MKRALDRLLKFRHLRMVEALVRFQSLTRAASHLGLTQPALTKAIRELEELIGEPLFDRHARGVRPTEAVGLLPAVLQRVRTDQPHLRLRVVEGRTEDLLSKLDAGEVDLVVGRLYGPDAPDGLRRETLYAEPISIIARVGHPLHRIRRPTVRDLAEQDLVLPEFSQRIAHDIARYMENIGLSATPNSIRSTSRGFIREMVLGTDMITVMPRMVMGGDLLRGQVRVVPVAAPAMPRPAGVITNPRLGESPAARALVGVIRATIAELAASGDVDITR